MWFYPSDPVLSDSTNVPVRPRSKQINKFNTQSSRSDKRYYREGTDVGGAGWVNSVIRGRKRNKAARLARKAHRKLRRKK